MNIHNILSRYTTCLSRFTVRVFRERLSIYLCVSFAFGFEGGMWDLIVLVLDHCLSFILSNNVNVLAIALRHT